MATATLESGCTYSTSPESPPDCVAAGNKRRRVSTCTPEFGRDGSLTRTLWSKCMSIFCIAENTPPKAVDLWSTDAFNSSSLAEIARCASPGEKDSVAYSHAWFVHHRRREPLYGPWHPIIAPNKQGIEELRIHVIRCYWAACVKYKIKPLTVHLAVWILNRVLHHHLKMEQGKILHETYASIAAVAMRMALKFEERPEAVWAFPNKIWTILPLFDMWEFNKSESHLISTEAAVLRLLNDCLDAPLSIQFFEKFLEVGQWPPELVKNYLALGHYLLALSSFACGYENLLMGVCASKLAAATVVLSVKIVNGDTNTSYEFYPKRLEEFCQYALRDLQPAIRGLADLLRNMPKEASLLGEIYPDWGNHEWQ